MDEEEEEWYENRRPNHPPVPAFNPPPSQIIELKGRRLQVIAKLANIVITPEKPDYNGGVWHVEGMENEHIVASGIYYHDATNVS